ncbi:hypothetical protein [Bacteroides reticulotermitis]|uniref:hypothetical protein n=1 Tax=Bacteroides reticulotermitis TaxID=1133319 RepID=UPI003A851E3A
MKYEKLELYQTGRYYLFRLGIETVMTDIGGGAYEMHVYTHPTDLNWITNFINNLNEKNMGVYFDIDKTTGQGSGTIKVTPKSSFTGRGPVSETLEVIATNDATVKSSKVATRTKALTPYKGNSTYYYSATLDGTYTKLTDKGGPASGVVDVPNTAGFLKIVVPGINAGIFYIENLIIDGPETYVKLGNKWLTAASGVMSATRTPFLGASDGYPITLKEDLGLKASYDVEIIAKINENKWGYVQESEVYFGCDDGAAGDNFLISVTISQAKSKSTLSLAGELDFGTATAAKDVTVTSNDKWTANLK